MGWVEQELAKNGLHLVLVGQYCQVGERKGYLKINSKSIQQRFTDGLLSKTSEFH
jgi:hypothetical protein